MIKTCPDCDNILTYHKESFGETWICPKCGYGVHYTFEVPNPEKYQEYEKRNK